MANITPHGRLNLSRRFGHIPRPPRKIAPNWCFGTVIFCSTGRKRPELDWGRRPYFDLPGSLRQCVLPALDCVRIQRDGYGWFAWMLLEPSGARLGQFAFTSRAAVKVSRTSMPPAAAIRSSVATTAGAAGDCTPRGCPVRPGGQDRGPREIGDLSGWTRSRRPPWPRRFAASWCPPRRNWPAKKAANTNPPAPCWNVFERSGTLNHRDAQEQARSRSTVPIELNRTGAVWATLFPPKSRCRPA